ncbi:hypothetical protein CPB83DRAFT_303638 [Crepidotus variabilis]|uniref:Uncharacterized protein n=1 Tax=Crepidotus variabilis TaxID=179855 RepID=A0A9P6EGN0_9AGAR|nr:hypothetical protein CPB83DRAFT_303638 [Crepidotus variabilis]
MFTTTQNLCINNIITTPSPYCILPTTPFTLSDLAVTHLLSYSISTTLTTPLLIQYSYRIVICTFKTHFYSPGPLSDLGFLPATPSFGFPFPFYSSYPPRHSHYPRCRVSARSYHLPSRVDTSHPSQPPPHFSAFLSFSKMLTSVRNVPVAWHPLLHCMDFFRISLTYSSSQLKFSTYIKSYCFFSFTYVTYLFAIIHCPPFQLSLHSVASLGGNLEVCQRYLLRCTRT